MSRIAKRSMGAGFLHALGVAVGGLLIAWQAQGVDALEAGDQPVATTEADLAARAEVASADLASSLSWVASSLQTTAPTTANLGEVTAAENDALIESAVKKQLAAMTIELDQLSAALGSGSDPATTTSLLQSLVRRAAIVARLGQRTSKPLIPSEIHEQLVRLWTDVERLAVSRSSLETPAVEFAGDTPAGGAGAEVESLE